MYMLAIYINSCFMSYNLNIENEFDMFWNNKFIFPSNF